MKYFLKYNSFINEENIISNFIVYTGLFINEKDKEFLIKKFKPKFDNILLHHITIDFLPFEVKYKFGKEVKINIIGICEDDNAQAFLIEKIDLLKNKEYPHITYTLNKDVLPIYSNDLVKNSILNNAVVYFKPIEIVTKLGYFNTKEIIF